MKKFRQAHVPLSAQATRGHARIRALAPAHRRPRVAASMPDPPPLGFAGFRLGVLLLCARYYVIGVRIKIFPRKLDGSKFPRNLDGSKFPRNSKSLDVGLKISEKLLGVRLSQLRVYPFTSPAPASPPDSPCATSSRRLYSLLNRCGAKRARGLR